ncbi:MAG: DUF4403 family protein [Candidatus Cyclobacteriaceae bacterium M3_2C_046]
MISAFLLKSCKSIEPVAPEENYLVPQESFTRELSVINLPVNFDMLKLQDRINLEIKDLLYEDFNKDQKNEFHLKVWKKSPIQITSNNDIFRIRVPLKVWAKAGISFDNFGFNYADSRQTNFELDLYFDTRISMASDWRLTTKTASSGFEWIKKPVLNLGPVNLPLSSMLSGVIVRQQDQIARQLDKEIEPNLEVKKYVQDAWVQMQTPYQISKEYNVWLKITPEEILMTDLKGGGANSYFSLGIKAFTETFIGKKPEGIINYNLPQITRVDTIPSQFNIGLSSEISHNQITELLSQNFLGQSFTFNDKKHKVTITTVDLYGSKEKLVIEAGLKGSINGTVFLTGQPAYNPVTQTFYLENLDFDLDTKNKLIKTASWFLHGKLVDNLRQTLTFPLSDQIKLATKTIQQNLNNVEVSPGIFVNGKLEELNPSGIFITSQSVIAVVSARGKADIRIENFSY